MKMFQSNRELNSCVSLAIQAPVSFMVPAEENDANSDETSNSIIKAHPPKRFKRLEDEMLMLTQEELQRRHNEAEQRRNAVNILQFARIIHELNLFVQYRFWSYGFVVLAFRPKKA